MEVIVIKPTMNLRRKRPDVPDIREFNKAIGLRLLLAQQHALPGMATTDALAAINSILPRGKKLGYSTYSAWLNGNRALGCREADKLGYMFDIAPGWIVTGEGVMRPYPASSLKGTERFATFT